MPLICRHKPSEQSITNGVNEREAEVLRGSYVGRMGFVLRTQNGEDVDESTEKVICMGIQTGAK
jgi:hypothetical protein